jgi:hypothetical protein
VGESARGDVAREVIKDGAGGGAHARVQHAQRVQRSCEPRAGEPMAPQQSAPVGASRVGARPGT